MVSVSESCRKHFLVLYESYQKAKKKNGPVIWARAVLCREYLEKMADPVKEADIFEELFAGEKPARVFPRTLRRQQILSVEIVSSATAT
jgi:hypothetical protein